MVPVRTSLWLLLGLLLAVTTGCEAVCDDCFQIEIAQVDGGWVDCCTYERRGQDDDVLIRVTRLTDDDYLAGLGAACTWGSADVPYEAAAVNLDGTAVDGFTGFDVQFEPGSNSVVVSVDCEPARPTPQYPDVVLRLLDPDLATQFDPEGYADDEAVLVLAPVILP